MSTVIDDFNDQNLNGWSGYTSSVYWSSGYDFSAAPEFRETGYGNAHIYSSSGLPVYPVAGDTFEVKARLDSSGGYAYFHFGFQSTTSYYEARLNVGNDTFSLAKYVSSSYTALGSASTNTSLQYSWVTLRVEWGTDGTITLSVLNPSDDSVYNSISVTDTQYSSGGVGLRAFNSTARFDTIQLVGGAEPQSATLDSASVSISPSDLTATNEQSVTYIDSFDDQSLSEYVGQTGVYVFDTTVSQSGAAIRNDTTGSGYIRSYPGDGLPVYPAVDTGPWRIGVRVEASNQNLTIDLAHIEGETGNFSFQYIGTGSEIRLRQFYDSGGSLLEGAAPLSLSPNTWYTFELDWTSDGTLSFTVYDDSDTELASISKTNTNYQSRSGFEIWSYANNASGPWFDEFRQVGGGSSSPSPISAALDSADLAAFPLGLTTTPGATTATIDSAGATASPASFGVTPGAVTAGMDRATVAASAASVVATPGPVAPLLGSVGITPSAASISATAGATSVGLDSSSLIALSRPLGVSEAVYAALESAAIVSSPGALGASPGAVSASMSSAALSVVAESPVVALANLAVELNASSLAVSVRKVTPVAGPVSVGLESASVVLTLPDVGALKVLVAALDAASITSVASDVGAIPGPLSSELDAASAVISPSPVDVGLGLRSVGLDVADLVAQIPEISAVNVLYLFLRVSEVGNSGFTLDGTGSTGFSVGNSGDNGFELDSDNENSL